AGITRGDVVGLLLPHSAEYCIGLLTCLGLGAPACLLEKNWPPSLLAGFLESADVRVVLTTPELVDLLPAAFREPGRALVLDRDRWADAPAHGREPVAFPEVEPTDIALISMTSGTSGTPKAVLNNHLGCLYCFDARYGLYPYAENSRDGLNAFFAWECLRPLLAGRSAVVIPDDHIFDPVRLVDTLEGSAITRAVVPPSLFETLLDHPVVGPTLVDRLAHMEVWFLMGESCPPGSSTRPPPCCRRTCGWSLLQHVGCLDVSFADLLPAPPARSPGRRSRPPAASSTAARRSCSTPTANPCPRWRRRAALRRSRCRRRLPRRPGEDRRAVRAVPARAGRLPVRRAHLLPHGRPRPVPAGRRPGDPRPHRRPGQGARVQGVAAGRRARPGGPGRGVPRHRAAGAGQPHEPADGSAGLRRGRRRPALGDRAGPLEAQGQARPAGVRPAAALHRSRRAADRQGDSRKLDLSACPRRRRRAARRPTTAAPRPPPWSSASRGRGRRCSACRGPSPTTTSSTWAAIRSARRGCRACWPSGSASPCPSSTSSSTAPCGPWPSTARGVPARPPPRRAPAARTPPDWPWWAWRGASPARRTSRRSGRTSRTAWTR
ncbi:AMP-binding protein, partial [Saccharothrix sp. MB29]|nr:AMP-binding protein [Saccharothrix sp. MB29]